MQRAMGETEVIHRHSGWLIPLAFGFVILLLCGLMMGWYLRPGPRSQAAPTGQSDMVALTVRGAAFAVPENYIRTARARRGGVQDNLVLMALFPSFQGYSDDAAPLFAGNAPDSPVIYITLRGDSGGLDARGRLERIYGPYLADPAGKPGPFALTQYGFLPDTGYEGNELFAGTDTAGLMLFLCEQASADLPSPNCLAIERPLGRGLSLSYRFKRAYLARWREIASGVGGLIARFEKKS